MSSLRLSGPLVHAGRGAAPGISDQRYYCRITAGDGRITGCSVRHKLHGRAWRRGTLPLRVQVQKWPVVCLCLCDWS